MEEVGGGATRLRHQRSSPSHDRFLGVFRPPSSSAGSSVELSEHDIFNTPSGSSSPSPPARALATRPETSRTTIAVITASYLP
ncbi:UNVERIFIED_CONTAM: hypothetical protein Slati_0707000 [Sesamum latifolium]|uniref:Uncharacterized protein n=1 Tax=Sesamum latifolium TaxID=2727402 RepID=A0AAW2Y4W1_9LAMI